MADKAKQEGITVKKSENFDEWYTQVIIKSELADYSSVSGCMVFRPTAYAIWEIIQKAADEEFKKIGVKNVYFPLLIPEKLLKKETEHVEGFSPEVAWVTQTGNSKLDERLAIRPTSETIMYDSYSKWIRSWRDLPLRFNQWNSVLRWEFKHPVPFLRSREFLWNEGHTAFATEDEAEAEREQILNIYKKITEEYLALPGIVGRKTEKEKFAGAVASYSIEHLLPDGKAIQGPDFHHDSQNFSKVFDISFLDKEGNKRHAWQNTWAITTREIGVMAAVHSDDHGLVIPPMVAPIQVVIVPIFDEKSKSSVLSEARKIEDKLKAGFRVKLDDRDYYTPGWKFNEWELKGVPLRIEIGPKDLRNGQAVLVRRDNSKKTPVKLGLLEDEVGKELEDIQSALFKRASRFLEDSIRKVRTYDELKNALKEGGIAQAGWCGDRNCEDKVKEEVGAKITNLPLKHDKTHSSCVYCGKKSKFAANFAKSY